MTRDKDDTRRAEEYFKSACKLDPSVSEEADEGRQLAIAKRRSRRQRAADSAAERRRSVVEGVSTSAASCQMRDWLDMSIRQITLIWAQMVAAGKLHAPTGMQFVL